MMATKSKRGRGRPKLYRWAEWFAQPMFTLVQGLDYRCSDEAMVNQVRSAASHRGMSVSIAQGQDRVTVVVRGEMNAG